MTARKHCALCGHTLDDRQLSLMEFAQTTARFKSLPGAIVELLREAGERGLTAEELALITKKPVHVVAARLSGMHRRNAVAFRLVSTLTHDDAGREVLAVATRETRAGKKARVHVLAPTEPGAADTAQLTREVA